MTTQTIPASEIVSVNPGVISAGGTPLVLNGVCLSTSTLLPTGSVESFADDDAVSEFFGPASAELAFAETYFLGNDNSTIKPGTLFFAPFNVNARAAWIQSGSFAGVSLATIQALNGSLDITVDGYARAAGSINLSSASSFTVAATDIQTGLNASPSTIASASACTISTTTLTVGGTITGTFAPGQTLLGSSVTTNTIILAQLTGSTGAAGTYSLSQSSTVASPESMTTEATPVAVTWDSINSTFVITSGVTGTASSMGYATGTIAVGLQFTSATGGILSQGAVADTPASAMDNVVANTQNWATFTTLLEPSLTHKLEYAVWNNEQNQRYTYMGWDTDVQATVSGATEPFGVVVDAAKYNGIMPLYNNVSLAAFVMGYVASIDFSRTNGRSTGAFKSQSGFAPTCNNAQTAKNLKANGYNFYGIYATANDNFNFLYNGQISGEWDWLDTYVGQIYLNAQFQLALMNLLTTVTAVPYVESGYALIRAAMQDPINQFLNFGGIRAGVVLSAEEAAAVNNAAGLDVSITIQNQGYYLQVLDPGAIVRGGRGTPIINFWYTDGGSVQNISLASVDIM